MTIVLHLFHVKPQMRRKFIFDRQKGRFLVSQTKKTIPWKLLVISLAIILLFSFLASMFNSGMFNVSVSRISFDTANGQLSGLLYMPKGVDEKNPRPAVIVTHGYLNSAEMQDANAIELSRRGYVVLALDMYDHGHSNIKEEIYENFAAYGDFLKTWAPFWLNSMNDAVQYMYDQPYVLKDEAGNGIIGITGHSMGGFSSTMAVAYDEQSFAATGIRKVYANLTEGSDFQYSSIFGVTAAAFDAAGGGRYLGKVAAQCDDFFFNAPGDPAGTVRKKDYVSTPDGMTFLQQTEAAEANTWYDASDGGHRIIYEPAETHPWNHFSTTTTANAVNFYNAAFADFMEKAPADGNSQIWYWKEICEFIALVGFVLFIMAFANLLTCLPFFRLARTELPAPAAAQKDGKLAATILILIVAIMLPALLFETFYGWSPDNGTLKLVREIACGLCLAGGIFALCSLRTSEHKKGFIVGGILALAAGAGLAFLTKKELYTDTGIWTAPVINDVAKWTVGCTFVSLIIMALVFVFFKARDGVKFANYGITFKPMAIVAGLCSALISVAAAYGLLFLVDALFKTDFRIWTFAFKTFDGNILPAILRYLPTFLAFYIVSSASICINTNSERLQGWKGYVLAVLLNAGGIACWLIRQYSVLFNTGVSAHPGAALSGIVLVAMVPTLAIAACISRYLYKRTGNIWLPAFLNGILMTIMAVANTTVYFK